MIGNGGAFRWSGGVEDGIRQDVSDSTPHIQILRNLNWQRRHALQKDKGVRVLVQAALESGAYDTFGGVEARFSDGTQKILLAQDDGTYCKLNVLNATTRAWAEETPNFARQKPCMVMFANKLHVFDGTTLRAWDGTTWTTPGTATVNDCSFGVVYANRLMAFHDASHPYEFWASGVRDGTDWDDALGNTVMGTGGEKILGAGVCGPYLIVGGEDFTRAYTLGTATAYDWTWDAVSDEIGPVNWQSFVSVTRPKGNESAHSFTFFWSKRGPVMVARFSEGLPIIMPLWDSIAPMCKGEDFKGMQGLDLTDFANVEGVYAPETDEVRFCVQLNNDSQRHVLLCLNVTSAIAFASNEGDSYPKWRTRDNPGWDFPVSTLFTIEVHPDTGLPTTTGLLHTFCAQDGKVYEMDVYSSCKDEDTYPIEFNVSWDGIDGAEDEVREFEKSVRDVYIHCTQEGDYDVTVRVRGDGGFETNTDTVNLSNGLLLWGSDLWGNTLWSAGSFVTERADFGVLGHKFQLTLSDDGAVSSPVAFDSWMLSGYVEGLR